MKANLDPLWICIGKSALLNSDKEYLWMLTQQQMPLLKRQLVCLLQCKELLIKMITGLQIVHFNGCHWVTVCNSAFILAAGNGTIQYGTAQYA